MAIPERDLTQVALERLVKRLTKVVTKTNKLKRKKSMASEMGDSPAVEGGLQVLREKSLEHVGDRVHRAEVIHHDGKIMIPNNMEIDDVIQALKERKEYMNQDMEVNRTYDVFPWDGALAIQRVFKERFGWVPGRTIPGDFFTPDQIPQTISVEVGYKQTQQVPWGRFGIPGVKGTLETCFRRKQGRVIFGITGFILRKDEWLVNEILDEVQQELNQGSIYLGQAIGVRFYDDDGDELSVPEVKFLDAGVTPESLILSRDLEQIVETNLLTPIRRAADCELNGIQVKRGILLGGPYGTGKTLAAAVAAHEAVKHGVTYVYVQRADELAHAIKFARQYDDPACVVFCEDVDRIMHGERNVEMDDLLNVIDGIDGKDTNIIVVLTSNFLTEINQALLRPGRLDAVIEVLPPDAEAVQRLLRHYAGSAISLETDLSGIGDELQGNIPAIIEEVVKRAKLAELRRINPGELVKEISEESLMESAKTMTKQLALLEERDVDATPTLDSAMRNVVSEASVEQQRTTKKAKRR
jgi:transitional endoplasmic reticulum ATPase